MELKGRGSIRLRKEIQRGVDEFFGISTQIDERMWQVLEYTDQRWDLPADSWGVFAAALRFQPSIAEALGRSGVDTSRLPLPRLQPLEPDGAPFDWPFPVWFHNNSRALASIRQRANLSTMDVILGALECRYLLESDEVNELVAQLGYLVGAVGRQGFDEQVNHPAVDDFCRRFARALLDTVAIDASVGSQQFLLYGDGRRYYIRPFGSWGAYRLQESPLKDGSLWVVRGNVIEPLQRFRPEAIAGLEDLINSDASEQQFQTYFEEHEELLLTLGDYKALHPQLILHEEDGSRLVPDFFLEKLTSDFCDICDLKRPTAELVRLQRHRVRFRDAIHEAVAQLGLYRDWFEDRANRRKFKADYGLSAYRPRVVVIIGRRQSFYDEIQRIRLEAELPPWVVLRTYDDVVESARQWRSIAAEMITK